MLLELHQTNGCNGNQHTQPKGLELGVALGFRLQFAAYVLALAGRSQVNQDIAEIHEQQVVQKHEVGVLRIFHVADSPPILPSVYGLLALKFDPVEAGHQNERWCRTERSFQQFWKFGWMMGPQNLLTLEPLQALLVLLLVHVGFYDLNLLFGVAIASSQHWNNAHVSLKHAH